MAVGFVVCYNTFNSLYQYLYGSSRVFSLSFGIVDSSFYSSLNDGISQNEMDRPTVFCYMIIPTDSLLILVFDRGAHTTRLSSFNVLTTWLHTDEWIHLYWLRAFLYTSYRRKGCGDLLRSLYSRLAYGLCSRLFGQLHGSTRLIIALLCLKVHDSFKSWRAPSIGDSS